MKMHRIGLKMSNEQEFGSKKFLILEKEPYRYQRVLSDISGNDIKSHRIDPEQVVKVVRDWFKPTNAAIPMYKEIWLAFVEFEYDYERRLLEVGYDPKDINSLTFSDIIEKMREWVTNYKAGSEG